MIRLVLLFIGEYLKVWGIALASGVGLLVLGPRLGVDREMLALPLILLLSGGLIGGVFLQKNTSWIKSLPLSKTEIFLGAMLSSLLNLVLMGIVWVCYAGGLFMAFGTRDNRPYFERMIDMLHLSGFISSAEGFLFALILFGGIFFTTFNPFVNRLKQVQMIQNIPLRMRLVYASILGGAFYILSEVRSTYVIEGLLLCAEWIFFYQALNRELAIYPTVRGVIRWSITILLFFQLGFVYAWAHRDLNSESSAKILGAQRFLGVAALPIPEARLVRIFNEDQDPVVIEELLDANPRVLNLVNVDVWLKAKSDPRLVLAIESKLQPEGFDKAKVEQLLLRYDELKFDPKYGLYMRLLHAKIQAEDVKDFVTAPGNHAFAYGLMLCRWYLDQACVPVITERLKSLDESNLFSSFLIRESLETLTLLKAEVVGFNFFSDVKAGHFNLKDWVEPQINCKVLVEKDFKEGSSADLAQLNYCIRSAAHKTPPNSRWNQSVSLLKKEEVIRSIQAIRELLKRFG